MHPFTPRFPLGAFPRVRVDANVDVQLVVVSMLASLMTTSSLLSSFFSSFPACASPFWYTCIRSRVAHRTCPCLPSSFSSSLHTPSLESISFCLAALLTMLDSLAVCEALVRVPCRGVSVRVSLLVEVEKSAQPALLLKEETDTHCSRTFRHRWWNPVWVPSSLSSNHTGGKVGV